MPKASSDTALLLLVLSSFLASDVVGFSQPAALVPYTRSCRKHSGFACGRLPDRNMYKHRHLRCKERRRSYSMLLGKGSQLSETTERLKEFGMSGVIAYGVLNATYYSIAFTIAWFTTAPAQVAGLKAAFQRFVKVMAFVWAGSQVTKIFRIGGAVALSPICDRLLLYVQARLGLKSKEASFATIASVLLLSTFVVFGILVVTSGLAPVTAASSASKAMVLCTLPLYLRSGSFSRNAKSGVMELSSVADTHGGDTFTLEENVTENISVIETIEHTANDANESVGEPWVRRRGNMSPTKWADLNQPIQYNIHGWQEHPTYLLGYWNTSSITMDSKAQEKESLKDSDLLKHCVEYIVLKKRGGFKTGPIETGASPSLWRFTPANRRLVFEVDIPEKEVSLRYSLEIKRVPHYYTKAIGNIRIHPLTSTKNNHNEHTNTQDTDNTTINSDADTLTNEHTNSNVQDNMSIESNVDTHVHEHIHDNSRSDSVRRKTLPASNRNWPILAHVTFEKLLKTVRIPGEKRDRKPYPEKKKKVKKKKPLSDVVLERLKAKAEERLQVEGRGVIVSEDQNI